MAAGKASELARGPSEFAGEVLELPGVGDMDGQELGKSKGEMGVNSGELGFTESLDPGVHVWTREDDMEVDEGNVHQVGVAENSSNGGMGSSKDGNDDKDKDDDTNKNNNDTNKDNDALLAEQVHEVIQVSSDL
ncbi:hypothetical protein H2248_003418 [Termitomyces sp. 'cryptogamus']|nr:hypothetical protein H2248_003418 [Termitomyces sp. 'cryptogamus']